MTTTGYLIIVILLLAGAYFTKSGISHDNTLKTFIGGFIIGVVWLLLGSLSGLTERSIVFKSFKTTLVKEIKKSKKNTDKEKDTIRLDSLSMKPDTDE